MSRTFCTVIDDERANAVLHPYGETMAAARHWSFKQIHVLGHDVAAVKKEALRKFGLTARQFNGVRYDLDQAVNASEGTAKFQVRNLKDSIEATVERIAALERQMENAKTDKRRESLKFKQIGKKRRLDVLRGRLSVAEKELADGRPRICFGGRDLLRDGNVDEWRVKRNSRIFLVGSKSDGPHGNQSVHWDGDTLTLRMPDSLGGKPQVLQGVKFRYGQKELLAVLERNRAKATRVALTWLIFLHDDGRWHAHVTVEEPVAEVVTDIRHGVVAVDVNADHLAVTLVDHWGNPVGRLELGFPEAGMDEGRAGVIIGDSVRALCLLARSRGYGIAVEELEFSTKKAGLREYGTAHARRLSGWSYAKFFQVIEARCKRDGVDLAKVNPAFTSVIGRTKYARSRAMSTHHAAALVIGRAAQGHGERLVTMDGTALDAPARMRPRTERRRWRGVRRLARETKVACTARSGVKAAKRGGPRSPASVTARKAIGPPDTDGRTTCDVSSQVGGAVALARKRSAYLDTPVT